MMGFDHGRLTAKSALHHVGIDGSLGQEVHGTNLLCLFLEDADEFLTNDFTLALRLSDTRKLYVIAVLCIHTHEVQVKLTADTEYALPLISLVLTKQAVIYEYAGQLLSDGSGKKAGCNGGIYAAGQREQNAAVADFLTNFLNGIGNKGIHFPGSCTATDISYKVIEHLGAFRRMKHFRMELDGVEALFLAFGCCHGAICRRCHCAEARRKLGNVIKMTHPADGMGRYVLEQRGGYVHVNLGLAIFSGRCTLYLAAKHVAHQLCAIAKAQHGNAKLKKLGGAGRRILFIAAARTARQDNALGVHVLDLLQIGLIGIDFAVHVAFADASCNKLIVLSTEINDQHLLLGNIFHKCFLLCGSLRCPSCLPTSCLADCAIT